MKIVRGFKRAILYHSAVPWKLKFGGILIKNRKKVNEVERISSESTATQ